MDNQNPVSTELRQFLSAPVRPIAAETAFQAHGIWAPGVRVMRNLYFSSKAFVISALFLVPIGLLGYFFVSSQIDQIAFTLKEREGVKALQKIVPVYTGALQIRAAARAGLAGFDTSKPYSSATQATGQALAGLDQFLTDSGDTLGLRPRYTELKAAWDAAAPSKQGQDAQHRFAYESFLKVLAQLVDEVGDSSNLVLDPDIDSFYLVNTTVLTLPKLADDVGQLWGWSTYFLTSARAGHKDFSAADLSQYAVWAANTESRANEISRYTQRAIQGNPQLQSKVDVAAHEDLGLYLQSLRDVNALVAQDTLQPDKLYATGEVALQRVVAVFDKDLPVLDGLLAERAEHMQVRLRIVLGVVGCMLLLAAYFFYAFFLVTRGGLRLISRHLTEIAQGDLRHAPSNPWGSDEPASVILDLRTAYDALHMLIRKVRHSARALDAASDEIAAASVDLSSRTEAAASMLEEQASSMEEIGEMVGATAERARMAATFAEDNAHVAEKGGQVFDTVVSTMREIQSSSSKIGDIIGVIDGIAFQTNILALNAAVEAARAGESGRGFAVVAAEVRGLAKRSAAAAREIKTLIATSVEKVQSGTEVVEDAGRTMHDVVTNARQINVFLSEISIAAQQQATGVEQVGQAIQELDKSTQQNAALVEETAGAAGSLRQQADILQEEIRNFRVA